MTTDKVFKILPTDKGRYEYRHFWTEGIYRHRDGSEHPHMDKQGVLEALAEWIDKIEEEK